ncbi:hypothetical protein [Vitiosangium sp. GDMCC 1.1324]|uniref:hypothetical protein n=1 Tax=Vitiosangium sp. (strain GDMCC 1.1324) TaxID=2138576 RepID=UPI000D3BB3FD|nr:hypothetical protein [Vitiosangium sp. GDMCC 1.1324]PTL80826.1 hypothetical protein DAT35_26160 [Vitiosangium sp. GDMCC 1.1324]
MMRSPALSVSVLAVFLGGMALAEAPPRREVEEFPLTDTAYPQEALELQVTLGVRGERRSTWDALELSLLTELGLTDRLQVELRAPLRWTSRGGEVPGQDPSGSGIEAGLLYALISRPDLGLVVSPGFEVELPRIFSQPKASDLAATPFVAVAQILGPARLHLNLALEVRAPRGSLRELELEPTVGVAATVPLGTLVPLLEFQVSWEDEARAWVGPGLVWRPASWFELGLGLPARLGPGGVAEVRPTLLLTGELELDEERNAPDSLED